MLNFDNDKRISMKEILEHNYVKNTNLEHKILEREPINEFIDIQQSEIWKFLIFKLREFKLEYISFDTIQLFSRFILLSREELTELDALICIHIMYNYNMTTNLKEIDLFKGYDLNNVKNREIIIIRDIFKFDIRRLTPYDLSNLKIFYINFYEDMLKLCETYNLEHISIKLIINILVSLYHNKINKIPEKMLEYKKWIKIYFESDEVLLLYTKNKEAIIMIDNNIIICIELLFKYKYEIVMSMIKCFKLSCGKFLLYYYKDGYIIELPCIDKEYKEELTNQENEVIKIYHS